MPDTSLAARMPERLPGRSSALGWVEAWRGPCTHWVATDNRGQIARVKVTDPSFLNWPGLVHAVPGNIIPDFPVINKSFNLSYSGNDR
jgi:Ni,Fe-hydrogenase III large subunit